MTKRKRAKMRHDVVSSFRDKVLELFKEHASRMDGADVVSALKQAGEEI
jgi:Fe2+ or Zn2+ uptake regulation protein